MVRNCSFLLDQEETPRHNMDSWCRFPGVNILHHHVASGVLSGSRFWGPRASRGPERALKSASQCPLVHCDPHSIPHCPLFQLETAQIVEQWQLHRLHEPFSNWCPERTRTDHLRRARLSWVHCNQQRKKRRSLPSWSQHSGGSLQWTQRFSEKKSSKQGRMREWGHG